MTGRFVCLRPAFLVIVEVGGAAGTHLFTYVLRNPSGVLEVFKDVLNKIFF